MKFEIKSKTFQDLKEVVERVPRILVIRILYVWLRIQPVFNFFYKQELQEMNRLWSKFSEEPLKIACSPRQAERVIRNIDTSTNETDPILENSQNNNGEGLNLVDVFKQLQKNYPNFTDQGLEDEMMTLYVTVSNTVGLLTSSCLLALAYYPSIQVPIACI